MTACQPPIRANSKHGVIQQVRLGVSFGMRQENRESPTGRKTVDLGHPVVRLRLDPLSAKTVGKGVPAHGEFGSQDSGSAEIRGFYEGHGDEVSVACESPRDGREVQERDS